MAHGMLIIFLPVENSSKIWKKKLINSDSKFWSQNFRIFDKKLTLRTVQSWVECNKVWFTVGVWSRSLILQALFNLGPSVLQFIKKSFFGKKKWASQGLMRWSNFLRWVFSLIKRKINHFYEFLYIHSFLTDSGYPVSFPILLTFVRETAISGNWV